MPTNTVGMQGRRLLTHAPIPAGALPQLRTEFPDPLCFNRHLDAGQRIEWLESMKKCPATVAQHLARYPFTAEEAPRVLEADKRRSIAGQIIHAADGDVDVIRAVINHPAGTHAADGLVGHDSFPQRELLLNHGEHITPVKRVKLLLRFDRSELTDEEAGALLGNLDIEDTLSDMQKAILSSSLSALVHYRPGVMAVLRSSGTIVPIAQTAVAGSPWITEDDVSALLASNPGRFAQLALAGNLWVPLDGQIASGLTDPDAVTNLAKRAERSVNQFTAPVNELDGDELEEAMFRAMPSRYKPTGRAPLSLLLATNPNLDQRQARRLAAQVEERASDSRIPLWVAAETVAAFTANFPKLAHLLNAVQIEPYPAPNYASHEQPERDVVDQARRIYEDTPAHRVALENSPIGDAVLELFAADLGGDADAWVAAVVLADSMSSSYAELAAIAAATS